MKSRNRKTAGILALSALLASGAGLAGCGTSAASEAATAGASGETSSTDAQTEASSSYQVECNRGIVNDPYPGLCHDYIDSDGNSICDLSEPDVSASTSANLVSLTSDDADDSTSGGCPLAPCTVCGICANLS